MAKSGTKITDEHFQPFADGNTWRCGSRNKSCKQCGRRYSKSERELTACPDCGCDRRCRSPIAEPSPGSVPRCRVHGGRSLFGISHPRYRTGVNSSFLHHSLPKRLKQKFLDALADPQLLALSDENALVRLREAELAERLYTGESGTLWKALKDSWEEFGGIWNRITKAASTQDVALLKEALTELQAWKQSHDAIINHGLRDEFSWKELVATIHDRVAVARAEHARRKEMHQMLSIDEAMALLAKVSSALRSGTTKLNATLIKIGIDEQLAEKLVREHLNGVGQDLHRLVHVSDQCSAGGESPD